MPCTDSIIHDTFLNLPDTEHMKNRIFITGASFSILFSMSCYSQPCKLIKIGMMPSEVQKLVGPPTEVDTIRLDTIGMKP